MASRTAVYPSYDVSYNRRGSIGTMVARNVEDDTAQGVPSLEHNVNEDYARGGPAIGDRYRASGPFSNVMGSGYRGEAKEREHSGSDYLSYQHPLEGHRAGLQVHSRQSADGDAGITIRVDENQGELDESSFYATSRSDFGTGWGGIQGLLTGAFRFFKTLAQRNQYMLTTPLHQSSEVEKNRADMSGQQFLQRPPVLRLLCFGGGLTLCFTSAIRLFNVLMLFTNFSAYIIYGFQTFFGVCMMLVEANDDWNSLEQLRPWVAQWLRFLTVPAGKGFFYVFVGALGLSSRLWANSFFGSLLGLYILGLGVISIIIYFKGGQGVNSLTTQSRKVYSTAHGSPNLAMAVSPEHFAYPETGTEAGDDDYDWDNAEDGRASRLTQPFGQREPQEYSPEQLYNASSSKWGANQGLTEPAMVAGCQERAGERISRPPFVKEDMVSFETSQSPAHRARSQQQQQQEQKPWQMSSTTSSASSASPFSNEDGQRYTRDSRKSAVPPRVKGGATGQRGGIDNRLRLSGETGNALQLDEAHDNIAPLPHRKEYRSSYKLPSLAGKGIHRSNATIVEESEALRKSKHYPKPGIIGEADEAGSPLTYEGNDRETVGDRYYIPDTTATGATSAASSYTREVTVGY